MNGYIDYLNLMQGAEGGLPYDEEERRRQMSLLGLLRAVPQSLGSSPSLIPTQPRQPAPSPSPISTPAIAAASQSTGPGALLPQQPSGTAYDMQPSLMTQILNPITLGIAGDLFNQKKRAAISQEVDSRLRDFNIDGTGLPLQVRQQLLAQAVAGPEPIEPPNKVMEYRSLINQGWTEKEAADYVWGKGGTTVNVGGTPELDVVQKAAGTDLGKSLLKQSNAGIQGNQDIENSLNLAANTTSGFWTEASFPLRKAMAGVFGVDVVDEELLTRKGMDNALKLVEQTKGAISNTEWQNFLKAAPGIGREPLTNFWLFKLIQRRNDIYIDRAAKYQEYIQDPENSRNPLGFDAWYSKNGRFADREKHAITKERVEKEFQKYRNETPGSTPGSTSGSEMQVDDLGRRYFIDEQGRRVYPKRP